MIRSSAILLTLLLAAAPASAGPFMRMLKAKQAADAARAAAAEVPALPEAAIPNAAQAAETAAAGAPAAAPAAGAVPALDRSSPFYPVEAQRNGALQKLADAGGRQILKDAGLILWRFDHSRSSVGAAYSLTVSFFDGGRDDDELRDHVKDQGPSVAAKLAGALGVRAEDVQLRARPSDFCCGSGCSTCLRSKPDASEYWTGRPPQRNLKR